MERGGRRKHGEESYRLEDTGPYSQWSPGKEEIFLRRRRRPTKRRDRQPLPHPPQCRSQTQQDRLMGLQEEPVGLLVAPKEARKEDQEGNQERNQGC